MGIKMKKEVANKKASDFAEKYGIVAYRVIKNCMAYYINDGGVTYRHTVNLSTGIETAKPLRRHRKYN